MEQPLTVSQVISKFLAQEQAAAEELARDMHAIQLGLAKLNQSKPVILQPNWDDGLVPEKEGK